MFPTSGQVKFFKSSKICAFNPINLAKGVKSMVLFVPLYFKRVIPISATLVVSVHRPRTMIFVHRRAFFLQNGDFIQSKNSYF